MGIRYPFQGIVDRKQGQPYYYLGYMHTPSIYHDHTQERGLQGSLSVFPQGSSQGSRPEKYEPGNSVVLWKPGMAHLYGNSTTEWHNSWLRFNGSELHHMIVESGVPFDTPINLNDGLMVDTYLTRLYSEFSEYGKPNQTMLRNILSSLLIEIGRGYELAQENAAFDSKSRVETIRRHIDCHFTEALSLDKLATAAGYTPQYLCRRFKEEHGEAPMRYLRKLRLTQAKHLLEEENRRIGEVADACGFSDAFQFSKAFKKEFGLSPNNFRKRLRG